MKFCLILLQEIKLIIDRKRLINSYYCYPEESKQFYCLVCNKLMDKVFFIISFLFILSSCAEESIDPLWQPETLNEQRAGKPYVVTYPIQNLEVSRFAGDIGDIPVVGGVFQRLAEVLADITIEEEEGTAVNIDPQVFNVPELDEVDFDYIKNIKLEAVHLTIMEKVKESNASLNFIKKIQVFIKALPIADDPNEQMRTGLGDFLGNDDSLNDDNQIIRDLDRRRGGINNETSEEDDENSDRVLVLSYNKEKSKTDCLGTCIDLNVHNVDWINLLENNRKFIVGVKFEIDRVPKGELELNGFVRMSVGLNTAF
jgi:hypothetical protein